MISPPDTSTPHDRVRWSDGTVPAVAPVRVRVARGCDVTVDAAVPSRAIAWSLSRDADPGELKAVFVDPASGAVVDEVLAGRSGETRSGTLDLRPEWTHRAVAVAVDELCPLELDEATLLLDLAAAEADCGDTIAAAAHVALAAPYLEALLLDAAEGAFPPLVAREVGRMGSAAARAVADTEWGVRLADLAAALSATSGFDGAETEDEVLEEVVEAWRAQIGLTPEPADNMLGVGDGPRWVPEIVAPIDPVALRPRRARWSGAESAELLVSRSTEAEAPGEQGPGRVGLRVTLPLSSSEAAEPGEIDDVRCYAVRVDGTAMVRIARMRREGRDLVADLHVPADLVDDVTFGVVEDARGLAAVRTGELAGELRRVDRYMIESWCSHRAAGAARALGSGSDRAAADLLDEAGRSGKGAATVLRTLADRLGDSEDGVRARRRAESVEAFLESVGAPPGEGEEPLLAELLPAEEPDTPSDRL